MNAPSTRIAWLVAAVGTLFVATRAEAIPALSRQTGMGCPVCHDSWPRLNDFGELFRDRGYRTGTMDNDVFGHGLDSVPLSFRTTVGYQYQVTTRQATDMGDQTIGTGGFASPVADIYFAIPLSNHVSAYVDIAGFAKDGTASLESAWARLNDLGSHWLNLKLGKLELDLPVSMHRSLTIFSPFLIYGYHPAGSMNGFNPGENQLAIDLMGHADGPGLRYSMTLASSGDVASASALSAPTIYGHVTYTGLLDSRIVSRVRVGLAGQIGWWPTTFMTLTPMGGMPAPVAGTGTDHKAHAHAGADLQVVLGPLAEPLTLTAVWLYGQEDASLVTGGTRDARFHGGFLQVDYTPTMLFTFGARYDGVRNLQQADVNMPDNSNDQDGFSFFGRYALWVSAWGSLVVHTELGTVKTQNAAAVATNAVRNTFLFGGFDFLL